MVRVRNSNLFAGIAILLIICCFGMVAQGKYGGGTGEPNDPYQIWDANHMQAIGADPCDWDKSFVLMADIDLSQFDGKDGREKFNMIGDYWCSDTECRAVGFAGVFNGNGRSIYKLTVDWYESAGLFRILSGGTIKDLGLVDPNVSALVTVGSLVGVLSDGTIEKCYVEGGRVSGCADVGGLVGRNGHCFQAYGECFWVYAGTISDCYVVGTVIEQSVTSWECECSGGLVGQNWGTLTECYSAATVTGCGNEVGGLVGRNTTVVGWQNGCTDALIAYCYSASSVDGNDYVGGLVGRNHGGEIINCYKIGSVAGSNYVGGLAGRNECHDYYTGGWLITKRGLITNSYWDIETSNEPNMCGYQDPKATGCDPNYGKTTSEMYQQSTFTDWDFINIWAIGENQTYPYLRTVAAGDINKDHITNFLDLCIVAEEWMKGN